MVLSQTILKMIVLKQPIQIYLKEYLTIRLGDYSTIFAEPEENNCFSIIAQVIIRANAFSFFFSSGTSKIARWPF